MENVQYGKGKNIDLQDVFKMLDGEMITTTNFPESEVCYSTASQTIYDFIIHNDKLLYRHTGTGKGCFWTDWKDLRTGFPPEDDFWEWQKVSYNESLGIIF